MKNIIDFNWDVGTDYANLILDSFPYYCYIRCNSGSYFICFSVAAEKYSLLFSVYNKNFFYSSLQEAKSVAEHFLSNIEDISVFI